MKRFAALILTMSFVFGAAFIPVKNVNLMAMEVSAAESRPPAPKNTKAFITPTTVKLEWKGVKGASGYKIYRYDASSKKYKIAYTTDDTSYTITGLKAKKTYSFKVAAVVKKNGKSVTGELSKVIKVKTSPAFPKLSDFGFDEMPIWDDEAGDIVQGSLDNNPEMLIGLVPLNRKKSTKELLEEGTQMFYDYGDELVNIGYELEYFNKETFPTEDGFIITYRYKISYKGYCVGKLVYSICISDIENSDDEIGRYSFGMVMVVPGLQPENF